MIEITTGPELEAYGPYVSVRRGDTTHQVADCSVHPHGRDYARLFAASPKLLALLEMIHLSFGGGNIITFSERDIDEIGAAITAATTAPEAAPEPVRHVTIAGARDE
ncbi:hypothetical protein WI25_01390 [Burkholderia cepacia]|uniref:hypothetical protein n=1 Tax=Burkholderia cepacia TaxID=292 RepID=UPI0007594DA3|nr:hypothetical protein [Burkholderia cepacia]KUY74555.1 hypothetical protein WI25_01390 [Burkholderia cepacia]